MRPTLPILCLGLTALLAACQTAPTLEPNPNPNPNLSPSRAADSASTAPDLSGSRWQLRFAAGAYQGDYSITLAPGGKLISSNPQDNTPDNDRWEQHGSQVLLLFNDGFARFEGDWLPTQRLAGRASSPSAGDWHWEAERLPDAPAP